MKRLVWEVRMLITNFIIDIAYRFLPKETSSLKTIEWFANQPFEEYK